MFYGHLVSIIVFWSFDIVQLILLNIIEALDKYQSCVVNTVHDSIVIDIHPLEIHNVLDIIRNINNSLLGIVNKQFMLNFNVPLLLEAKMGDNWLDTKDVV